MNLEREQREFFEAVLAREEPADARLAIYHRSARASRRGALAAAYPVVRRLVGAAFFDEAADRYGLAFPSRSGDLNAYGSRLAGFLAEYPHARDLPYLADVARLEWALHESSHAPQGEPLDYAALGAVPPTEVGEVRIRLRPSVRLVRSAHPILAIWEANQGERDGTPARTEGPERVVVRRGATLGALPVALPPAEWAMLEAFARGDTVTQAAAACMEQGLAFEPTLVALARLDVLGGFVPAGR